MRINGQHNQPHPVVACALCLWRIGIGYNRIARITRIISKPQIRNQVSRRLKQGALKQRQILQKPRVHKPPKPDPIIKITRILINKKRLRQVKYLRRMVWRWLFVYKSSPTTTRLVGCSKDQFKLYIQSLFKRGMSWANYGKVWELDHIIPCRLFNLSDQKEIKRCFHYSNYQPLKCSENRSKSNKNTKPQQHLPLTFR